MTPLYVQVCDDVNTTRIVCILPALLLPLQIKSYLDSLVSANNGSQVSEDLIPADVTSIIRRGYVDDGAGNTMFVYVGLLFDGNVKYRNLSSQLGQNGSAVLIPGPVIYYQPPRIIDLGMEQETGGSSYFRVYSSI
jgi:hypothetical protein